MRSIGPNYIVNGDMSLAGGLQGAPITTGPEGRIRAEISWASTGSPVGTIALEFLSLSGTYKPIPGASAEFTANGNVQPASNAGDIVCHWRELQAFPTVRITYTRGSGGTANTSFNVKIYVS